jgi:Gpi18-like mannosyltransferase
VSDDQDTNSSRIRRESLFSEEILLIFISILLITQLETYLHHLPNAYPIHPGMIILNSMGFVIVFFGLCISFFPKKIKKSHITIIGITALILRLRVIFITPVVSSDLHRNLLFGSLLAGGWNPYLWTIETIPSLLDQGFVSKVAYTSQWTSHSYDYPALAIIFFATITLFVPADNFSAFILAKFSLMVVDVANAYLIYKIIKDHLTNNSTTANGVLGKKVALIYLLNPFSIIWIGLEGQFESIPIFFTLIAVYLVLTKKNKSEIKSTNFKFLSPYLAGIAIACGFLFKYFPIIFIPAFIYYYGKDVKSSIRFLSSCIITIFFLSIPFIFTSYYITNFLKFQINRSHNYLNETILSVFGVVEIPMILAIMVLVFVGLINTYQNKDRETTMFLLGTLSMFAFVFVNPSLFSWYILWLYPFLPFISSKNDEYLRSTFWGASLAVYVVMWSPNNPHILEQLLQIAILGFFLTWKEVRHSIKRIIEGYYLSLHRSPIFNLSHSE